MVQSIIKKKMLKKIERESKMEEQKSAMLKVLADAADICQDAARDLSEDEAASDSARAVAKDEVENAEAQPRLGQRQSNVKISDSNVPKMGEEDAIKQGDLR